VRTALLKAHQSLSDSYKWQVRNATLSENPFRILPFIKDFYQMHVTAYSECCCVGTPAPWISWVGIFYAGNLLSCDHIILPAILEFGRCGCGW